MVRAVLVTVASETTYGAAFADVYDEWYGESDDIDAIITFLVAGRPQRVLELGVGTGRIAVPLARALRDLGITADIIGVDESPEMIDHLSRRPDAELVRVVRGDMVDDQPVGPFNLILVSYNTLFNLVKRDRQFECIAGAARRLAPDGRLVVDACIIDPVAPSHGQSTRRRGTWTVDVESWYDRPTGALRSITTSTNDDGRVITRPTLLTYSTPDDIDSMCAAAGLTLASRHASWQKTIYNDSASRHVSVYRNVR